MPVTPTVTEEIIFSLGILNIPFNPFHGTFFIKMPGIMLHCYPTAFHRHKISYPAYPSASDNASD